MGSQQADGMGGVEREIVMVGPWGSLNSLRVSREEALQRLMLKKGHDLSKEVALNASELYAENAKWAEMDEVGGGVRVRVCMCMCTERERESARARERASERGRGRESGREREGEREGERERAKTDRNCPNCR